ncbi:MAG: [Lachnospiraceae bacterium]|nr:[FeFe] hydrogenase H-cluster maturation GTPase HydF [Lachnospiraceae bacterium]
MGLNDTPSANRIHIGFFGKTNAGKSSLVNAITGQSLAVVSSERGTTTDPVYKAMELLPLGPVLIMDTPGLDDTSVLGKLRIQKTNEVLRKTDIAIVVVDVTQGITQDEENLLKQLKERDISALLVWNKVDLVGEEKSLPKEDIGVPQIFVSTLTGEGVNKLKEQIPHVMKQKENERPLVKDLIKPLDVVVLVVPIDESAPKGRLILPQQQVIRELLECGAVTVVVKDTEYKQMLLSMEKKPRLVIIDSQVFGRISAETPEDIPLTSFSILMARKKGFLKIAKEGAHALDRVKDGDKILIVEGCTHHRQCGDIGTVKLPNWIRNHTQAEPEFVFCSGMEFPENLSQYQLVIHCGGCMLNEREMRYRMQKAMEQEVPFTNYGIAIAHMHHILHISVLPLEGTY